MRVGTVTPSPSALRAELESYVLGDLLGPAGGDGEELTERTVRDRCLVGVFAPAIGAREEESGQRACQTGSQLVRWGG